MLVHYTLVTCADMILHIYVQGAQNHCSIGSYVFFIDNI